MTQFMLENATLNPDSAIEIAEGVWWVGHYLEGDPFQCHVYLIKNGDQSVLFDPGSKLTFEHTLKKIEQVIPFDHIRYFVCHHQDPDITGAMPLIDEMITRKDAVLVTHWRAMVLLRHYGLKIPFWLVNENDWHLDLRERKLNFTLTPYAHFPGAFCTFDETTGTLFSSDLFGGFTEGFSLVAKDETYFESLRPFHEHYMPSRDILAFAITELERHPIKLIAPQHGSIIPEGLVNFMMQKLKRLDCGLFLLASETTDILSISKMNRILQEITETMVLYRDFKDIANALVEIVSQIFPAKGLEFYVRMERGDDPGDTLHLAPETRYRGTFGPLPDFLDGVLGISLAEFDDKEGPHFQLKSTQEDAPQALVIPLFNREAQIANGVAVIRLEEQIVLTPQIEQMLEQITIPLQVAVERESIYRFLDVERQKHYERSIRDSLTGLFTRYYMNETMHRHFEIHDRESEPKVALVMFDIDHFKSVNDTFGHDVGDIVLKRVAEIINGSSRSGDVAVRLGGEEFALFVIGKSTKTIEVLAERIRKSVEDLRVSELGERTLTISGGMGTRQTKEDMAHLIKRVDEALYLAKNSGRNQIREAVNPT